MFSKSTFYRSLLFITAATLMSWQSTELSGNLTAAEETTATGWPMPMTSDQAWQAMPKPIEGAGQPLPTWARMLAREMPRTAAAYLELDVAQRTKSPLEPGLRAAMRYVAASANGSTYAMATAKADAQRAGVSPQKWQALQSKDRTDWSAAERLALNFAHDMTVNSDGVTDEQFAELVKAYGERGASSMVLMMAYANFQDRLLICLGAPLEENGPLPPVKVSFASDAYETKTTPPPANYKPEIPGAQTKVAEDVIRDESEYTWLPYPALQERLQKQRQRKTRLPIPEWQSFANKLPKGLMDKPSDIVWYKIAFGYADELAVPFEIYMRTAGSEINANWDRPFGNCIFWMVTDAVKCPYCMGHCEMNWEVVGMSSQQIAELSTKLAGNDWSAFTEAQQHALQFARKLTKTPGKISRADIDQLRQGFGDQRAFFIAVNASRYNYMVRISNGFQLTLETGNPFWAYYRMPEPEQESGQTKADNDKSAALTQPRPTPVTRPEMKQLLEDMKQRRERIPLPAQTEADQQAAAADPRLQGYEGRLTQTYLPNTAGARSYLNFSGSPARNPNNPNTNRFVQEPDPALTLDYAFKTRLFWIASRVNNCQYCLGHQESKLLATGMTEDQIALLDSDWTHFPEKEQAAFALARKLTFQPHLLTDEDIEACRKHYSDLQILEMILSVAGNNAINRWKEGAGIPQSAGGGNFGGSTGDHHSYMTETSPTYAKIRSKVVALALDPGTEPLAPTRFDRQAQLLSTSTAAGLAKCAKRQPRLPLASEEDTRRAFGDLVPTDKAPAWMRLLANFPIAGKRQVTGFAVAERELKLSDVTRAQIAYVVARQNAAWYSLAEARGRLLKAGQNEEQLAALDSFATKGEAAGLSAQERALLTVAKHLAASPVVLTDAEVDEALKQTSPRDVVQTVHYTAMRSLFDRFTEAAALGCD